MKYKKLEWRCKSQSKFHCPQNDINFEEKKLFKNDFYVLVCMVRWFELWIATGQNIFIVKRQNLPVTPRRCFYFLGKVPSIDNSM